MNRRGFFKWAGAGLALGMARPFPLPGRPLVWAATLQSSGRMPDRAVQDRAIRDRLVKNRNFDRVFSDDMYLAPDDIPLLESSLARLERIQKVMGYGNFCLAGFDDGLAFARSYARVGRFTDAELGFLEKIFHRPAKAYGFFGEKPIEKITARINPRQTRKIPGTGNYLFRGKPLKIYREIQNQIGQDAVLTSGVRGVLKQFLLFLSKTAACGGNLSMASRSLAPPGYSFHGTGDFDVGEKGFGRDNFTEKFTQTRVYDRLTDLGYIKFRYDRENDLGVRFEPWHVEVG